MPAELIPWASIWNMAPFIPQAQYCDRAPVDQTANPRITYPMWLTDEYASSRLKSVCPMATNAPYTMANAPSAPITVESCSAAHGQIGKASRMMPYPPSLRSTPARTMLIGVGASTWASGSHEWSGTIGTLTANPTNSRANSRYW